MNESVEISEACIKKHAKSRGMYETPELNESLLLHGLGISSIGNLSKYTDVSSLILGSNFLTSFEGLNQFPRLKYLNLNNNSIREDLRDCLFLNFPVLEELHLVGNVIGHSNISVAHPLRVLNLKKNKLSRFPDISSLHSLEVLDISENAIERIDLVSALQNCIPKSILQLYMQHNRFIGCEKDYRKKSICAIPSLVYLDARTVTDEEREIAFASLNGADENLIRQGHFQQKQAARDKLISDFRKFQMNPELIQLVQEIEFIVS